MTAFAYDILPVFSARVGILYKYVISDIKAREVLDSRGNPTVEAEVRTAGGALGRAIVPSGASTGRWEACELRDANATRYDGRGVQQAVTNVRETIAPALAGCDPADQRAIDARLLELDPTPNKHQLGGNALLAVSLACAHAAADARGVALYQHLAELLRQVDPSAPPPRMPLPMVNMISGGLHAGGNLDFQDFLITPVGAERIADALEWIVRVYRRLGMLLAEAGYEGRLVGDEGGYGPRLPSNFEAAEFVTRAIEAAGLRPGDDVTIALDVAATHFFDGQSYRLSAEGRRRLTREEMIDAVEGLIDRFPIESVEDGLAEDDWPGWQRLSQRLGDRVRLVGDDLFTTNVERLRQGIEQGAANSILIKFNQIGTLSETFETIRVARAAGYGYVVSARSGETEDSTIADLAVASAAERIKIGSIVRGERLAKYNQLLRIAEKL
ncbi:MAG: phosphopyruvate hydratase [Planctomycetota bacterium]|nr:MAG: phosphopyruvate hydratase [Planctomycetota bacterium]